MNRYEQRRAARLQNSRIAVGYIEMDAELRLLKVLDEARRSLGITQGEMAERTGMQRAVIARLLTSPDANPTLDTFTEILRALRLKAEVTLRPADPDEAPIEAKFVRSR